MDWRSNFGREELERIDEILNFKQQVGYEPGSDAEIIARMASILDNAQGVIAGEEPECDRCYNKASEISIVKLCEHHVGAL